MTLKPTEMKTMTKKSTEAKYFGKTQTDFCQISVSNTSACLQVSAVILTIRNWHHIVQTSGNLNFSSTLEMHVFRQNIQLVTMYKQYGSIQGYLETCRYPWFHQTFVMKRLTNIAFTHCSSVWKYFLNKHPLLQNYISGRKEAVHIKYVSDLAYA